jgi:signal transduction histidine kinase
LARLALPGCIRPLVALSLERKFYLAVALALAALLLVGALSTELVRSARRHSHTLHESHAVLAQLTALAADLARLERLRLLHALAAVSPADFVAAHQDAATRIAALERSIPPNSALRSDLQVVAEFIERQRTGDFIAETPRLYSASAVGAEPPAPSTAGYAPGHSPADHIHRLVAMGRAEGLELSRRKASEELRLAQIRNWTLLIGIVACVLGAMLASMVRYELARQGEAADRLARMNDELDAKVQERTAELGAATDLLRKFSAHVEAAREAERLHVARDVHDALGSTLTALKLELSGSPLVIRAGRAGARCRRASVALVDLALQTVEDLVTELRPGVLDKFGLWEALRWKAAHFQERTGIECQLSMAAQLPLPSGEASTGIFRIVEEALTNVARHADARCTKVVVAHTDGVLEVDVADDGLGIAPAAIHSPDSFGLLGMSERARLLDGGLQIVGRAGLGTTVRLRVPLPLHEGSPAAARDAAVTSALMPDTV